MEGGDAFDSPASNRGRGAGKESGTLELGEIMWHVCIAPSLHLYVTSSGPKFVPAHPTCARARARENLRTCFTTTTLIEPLRHCCRRSRIFPRTGRTWLRKRYVRGLGQAPFVSSWPNLSRTSQHGVTECITSRTVGTCNLALRSSSSNSIKRRKHRVTDYNFIGHGQLNAPQA